MKYIEFSYVSSDLQILPAGSAKYLFASVGACDSNGYCHGNSATLGWDDYATVADNGTTQLGLNANMDGSVHLLPTNSDVSWTGSIFYPLPVGGLGLGSLLRQ